MSSLDRKVVLEATISIRCFDGHRAVEVNGANKVHRGSFENVSFLARIYRENNHFWLESSVELRPSSDYKRAIGF